MCNGSIRCSQKPFAFFNWINPMQFLHVGPTKSLLKLLHLYWVCQELELFSYPSCTLFVLIIYYLGRKQLLFLILWWCLWYYFITSYYYWRYDDVWMSWILTSNWLCLSRGVKVSPHFLFTPCFLSKYSTGTLYKRIKFTLCTTGESNFVNLPQGGKSYVK